MWNILIVLIIITIIWLSAPFAKDYLMPSPTKVDLKTRSEVNQVVNDAQKQVDYSRNMQYQERNKLDNQQ